MVVGMDLIGFKLPPSSEHLSLWAVLAFDAHPSTQQLLSRSSFPPKLELLLLQPPVLPGSKGHMALIFLLQPVLYPQSPLPPKGDRTEPFQI